MSDRDKLVVLGLFFIFLIGFFVLFIWFGDRPDSKLFQYLFFIAALTMAFTGFLGATGTFTTQGQALGGGAAIFLVMVIAVVGLKPYFTDEVKCPVVKCPTRDTFNLVIRSLEAPHKILQTSDGKFKGSLGNKLIETKEGKYEFPMAELKGEMIFMEKLSNNIKLDNVILEYHDDIPELQLYVKEEK